MAALIGEWQLAQIEGRNEVWNLHAEIGFGVSFALAPDLGGGSSLEARLFGLEEVDAMRIDPMPNWTEAGEPARHNAQGIQCLVGRNNAET